MTTKIFLVRHPEVDNPKQIVYGRLPGFSLSDKGRKEIEKSALFLASENIKSIYSSPLLRARQSAQALKDALNLDKINYLQKLIEIKTSFQGKTFKFVQIEQNEDYYFSPFRQSSDETMEQIAKRMQEAILVIKKSNLGKNSIAVGHGDPIAILKATIQNLPMKLSSIRGTDYPQHGEILEIKYENEQKPQIKSVFIPNVS